jgi:hypothetical protein
VLCATHSEAEQKRIRSVGKGIKQKLENTLNIIDELEPIAACTVVAAVGTVAAAVAAVAAAVQ